MDLALWKTWMNGMAGPGKFWKEKGKIGLKRQAGAISSESEGLSRSTGILTFSFYRKFWPKTWFGKMRPKEGTWKMPADSPKLLSSSSHPVINAGRGSGWGPGERLCNRGVSGRIKERKEEKGRSGSHPSVSPLLGQEHHQGK